MTFVYKNSCGFSLYLFLALSQVVPLYWMQVRAYRAKSIFQDLKLAKKEFIQANVYMYKETKLFLPKILYYFAKDMSLGMLGLLEEINDCLSDIQKKAIRSCMAGKLDKYIQWLPQSSTFRYVIHEELANVKLTF